LDRDIFRTDFAGASTKIQQHRSEYDSTVGSSARFQREYDGKQSHDPAKAAAAIILLSLGYWAKKNAGKPTIKHAPLPPLPSKREQQQIKN
jgi:hypothetical protein